MQMEMQQNNHLPFAALVKRMFDVLVIYVYFFVFVCLISEPIQMGLQSSIGFTAGQIGTHFQILNRGSFSFYHLDSISHGQVVPVSRLLLLYFYGFLQFFYFLEILV